MNIKLSNRFHQSKDGSIHIVPKGDYPINTDEGLLIQVVDDEALKALHASFPKELFIDFDHLSGDKEQKSNAAGWGNRSEIRADGLYTFPRWSEDGLKNIEGGNYRFISPVFDPDSAVYLGDDERTGLPRYRVTRLLEAGLTNKPNMRGMRPLSNREHNAPGENNGLPKQAAATKENHTMKLVNRALNLQPDASEDAATAGIEQLKTDKAKALTDLANRETDLTKVKTDLANRDSEIETLKNRIKQQDEAAIDSQLDAAGIKDTEPRKRWKDMLLANRETGTALLKDYVDAQTKLADAEAKVRKPLTNRETASKPGDKKPELTGLARVQAAIEEEEN